MRRPAIRATRVPVRPLRQFLRRRRRVLMRPKTPWFVPWHVDLLHGIDELEATLAHLMCPPICGTCAGVVPKRPKALGTPPLPSVVNVMPRVHPDYRAVHAAIINLYSPDSRYFDSYEQARRALRRADWRGAIEAARAECERTIARYRFGRMRSLRFGEPGRVVSTGRLA